MKVYLRRLWATPFGRFRPNPEGVVVPDSLFDQVPSDAIIMEAPTETKVEPDPELVFPKESFTGTMQRFAKEKAMKDKPPVKAAAPKKV